MKNPDETVNIAAFYDAKKLYLAGGGVNHPRYVNSNRNISSNVIF